LTDSVGSSNAILQDPDAQPGTGGGADLTTNSGQVTLGGGVKAESSYVVLGNNLIGGSDHAVAVEVWGTQLGVQTWSRIFEFGSSTADYLTAVWTRGDDLNTGRSQLTLNSQAATIEYNQEVPVNPLGEEQHLIVSVERFAGGGPLRDSVLSSHKAAATGDADFGPGQSVTTPHDVIDLVDSVDQLGRSQFGDDTANASYNEVRIYKGAPPVVVREILHDQGPDAAEVVDNDDDDLPDAWETANGLSATDDGSNDATNEGALGDLDSDGFNNILEMVADSDPSDAASTPTDIDADGLEDAWEQENFGNLDQAAGDDPDDDCDANLVEFNADTDPNSRFSFTDTDDDDLPDSWEVKNFGDITTTDGTFDNDEGVGGLNGNMGYKLTDHIGYTFLLVFIPLGRKFRLPTLGVGRRPEPGIGSALQPPQLHVRVAHRQ
jgi:hypothetical protein